jgi:protein O-mannosyl-transferase
MIRDGAQSFLRSLGGRIWNHRSTLALALLLVAATLVVYAQTCRFGFMSVDDPIEISASPHVQGGLNFQNLYWSFSEFYECNWIPLTRLSWMVDTTVFGTGPGGYHFTNVVLHAGNTVLLFAFLLQCTGLRLRSAFVAGLFALHPLHVESVAWITERKDVLSTLFGLLSLWLYARFARRGGRWRLGLCFFCFVCSLLSKQTLVTLPCLLVLLDYWPLGRFRLRGDDRQTTEAPDRRQRSTLPLIAEKLPFFAASAAASVIAIMAQSRAGSLGDLEQFPLSERSLNAVFVYTAYLSKAIFPQNLAIYYPYQHESLSRTLVVLSAVCLVAISIVAVVYIRRFPFLFVGWSWYLGTLIPLVGIVQIGSQQLADRYTYFPLIGVFIAVAWLVPELVPFGVLRTRVLPLVAAGILLLLGGLTFRQAGLWRDDVTLLRHTKECTLDNFRIHQLLGTALLAKGDLSAALAELETAVRLGPQSPAAHCAFGIGLQQVGKADEAARQYEAAIALNEADGEAHCNLGIVQLKRREYQAAKRNLRRAIEIDPNNVIAYVNFGALCLETGEYAEALAASRQAVAFDATSIRGRHNLAVSLIANGRLDEAIAQFQYLSQVLPDDPEARANLERALAMKRQTSNH